MDNNSNIVNEAQNKQKNKKSAVPIYAIGVVWLIWGVLFRFNFWSVIAVSALSLIVYIILDSLIVSFEKKKKAKQEIKVSYRDDSADKLILEGRGTINLIRQTNLNIKNSVVKHKVTHLCMVSNNIFDYIAKKPSSAPGLHKFISYYMPNFKKLTETYAVMEKQSAAGENITGSMREIEDMLDNMKIAFEKQLDALFEETALDISSDIVVMQQLMAQQGLTDEGQIN